MKRLTVLSLFIACLAPAADVLGQRDASPIDELPSYIRKMNDWGQRADFSQNGKHTLVESSRQFTGEKLRSPVQSIDSWKLSLDGGGRWERITHFTDFKGYKSSNPVVSDDGRYIVFQMARLGDSAGVGRGLFLLDITT